MNKKVLIIDDDAGIIDVLTIILEGEGYEVKSVDDDSQVFTTVNEFKPDLILLDVWMPGLGGKEICSRLKSMEGIKEIPVMIVSASVNIDQIAKECGADGYITKPFEMGDLTQIVKDKISA